MKAILYRCNESKHRALTALARSEKLSLQKLMDEFATAALVERQAEARFRVLQRAGNPARGRRLLADIQHRLDKA